MLVCWCDMWPDVVMWDFLSYPRALGDREQYLPRNGLCERPPVGLMFSIRTKKSWIKKVCFGLQSIQITIHFYGCPNHIYIFGGCMLCPSSSVCISNRGPVGFRKSLLEWRRTASALQPHRRRGMVLYLTPLDMCLPGGIDIPSEHSQTPLDV
jgi:hypothetical protein